MNETLQKKLEYVNSIYSQEKIVAIFEIPDKFTIALYIPSIQEIVTSKVLKAHTLINPDDNSLIDIIWLKLDYEARTESLEFLDALVKSTNYIFNPLYEDVLKELQDTPPHKVDILFYKLNKIAVENEFAAINAIKAKLTFNEIATLRNVLKEINYTEGAISISKFTKTYSISRPVVTNLINKLEKANCIETINQGINGTYIKVINSQICLI